MEYVATIYNHVFNDQKKSSLSKPIFPKCCDKMVMCFDKGLIIEVDDMGNFWEINTILKRLFRISEHY